MLYLLNILLDTVIEIVCIMALVQNMILMSSQKYSSNTGPSTMSMELHHSSMDMVVGNKQTNQKNS